MLMSNLIKKAINCKVTVARIFDNLIILRMKALKLLQQFKIYIFGVLKENIFHQS